MPPARYAVCRARACRRGEVEGMTNWRCEQEQKVVGCEAGGSRLVGLVWRQRGCQLNETAESQSTRAPRHQNSQTTPPDWLLLS